MTTNQTISPGPPFVAVEGVFNFRGVGGYPVTTSDSTLRVRPNLLFRSGELTGITDNGAKMLVSLGINMVIDLRSEMEITKWKTSSPHLVGINIENLPVSREYDMSHESLTAHLRRFETDELHAFLEEHKADLELLGASLEATIRHLLEDPDHPPLIHCAAGKDRTGLIVAVILLLLGVSEVDIAEEYALTTIGLKPAYELFTAHLSKIEAFRNNSVGVQNMGSSRVETMLGVCNLIREVYGDVERYVISKTSLTREDIIALREKTLVNDSGILV